MKRKVFSVFDSKAGTYGQPMFCPTAGIAVRAFQKCQMDPGHEFSQFAEDFTLFELGEFDDVDGKFTLLPAPQSVVTGVAALHELTRQSEDALLKEVK